MDPKADCGRENGQPNTKRTPARPSQACKSNVSQARAANGCVSLLFLRANSGAENASIARFFGLRCYQKGSGTGAGFWAAAGMKKPRRAGWRPGRLGSGWLQACWQGRKAQLSGAGVIRGAAPARCPGLRPLRRIRESGRSSCSGRCRLCRNPRCPFP